MPPSTAALLARAENAFWVLFVFTVMGGFAYALGPEVGERYLWLAADLLAVCFMLAAPSRYARLLWRNAYLFSWPAIAMLSTLWSLVPGLSLYHGAQLFMTMLVGLVIVDRHGLDGLARFIFYALLVALVLSTAVGLANVPGTRMWHGEWMGIFSHKNTLGAALTLLIYTAAMLALSGWRPILTTATALAALPVLLMSWSGASMVSLAIVLAAAPLVLAWRRGATTLGVAGALATSAAAAAVLAIALSGLNPVAMGLEALGKDETLTGRTLLWDFGLAAIADAPVVGLGYKAYWESHATTAAYLRFYFGQDIWTFHNNVIEVGVAFGLLGIVAFAIGVAGAIAAAVGRFLARRSAMDAWGLLVMVHILVLTAAENPLFYNHSLGQVLFVAVGARLAASAYAYEAEGRLAAASAR